MFKKFSCASWESVCPLEKCLFRYSAHFLSVLFVLLQLNVMSCLQILETNPLLIICKYYPPICGLSFHLGYCFLFYAKGFEFNQDLFGFFFVVVVCLFFHHSGRWIKKQAEDVNRHILHRRYTDGLQANEKMFSITNRQGNANQNYSEISPVRMAIIKKLKNNKY